MSEKIKIATIEFTPDEWQQVRDGAQRKNKKVELDTLSLPSILRLALGLETKKRGGARPNTGNRKPPLGTPSGVAKTGRAGRAEGTGSPGPSPLRRQR